MQFDQSEFLRSQHVSVIDFDRACKDLDKIIKITLERFEDIVNDEEIDIESMHIGHSGGKDSVVITDLTEQLYPNLPCLHTAKPDITAIETITFLYGLKRILLYIPQEYPDLPEVNHETQIDGTRRYEFNRTNGKATDFIWNGKSTPRSELPLFVKKGLLGRSYIYPIFDWTDAEVWAYILTKNIPFSKEYMKCAES